jgi:hypothetical protein
MAFGCLAWRQFIYLYSAIVRAVGNPRRYSTQLAFPLNATQES